MIPDKEMQKYLSHEKRTEIYQLFHEDNTLFCNIYQQDGMPEFDACRKRIVTMMSDDEVLLDISSYSSITGRRKIKTASFLEFCQ